MSIITELLSLPANSSAADIRLAYQEAEAELNAAIRSMGATQTRAMLGQSRSELAAAYAAWEQEQQASAAPPPTPSPKSLAGGGLSMTMMADLPGAGPSMTMGDGPGFAPAGVPGSPLASRFAAVATKCCARSVPAAWGRSTRCAMPTSGANSPPR